MTLHCEAKTENINLFLPKDQLLSKAAREKYTGGSCGQTFEIHWGVCDFAKKNELLHLYYGQRVDVCAPDFKF